jgi:hypothetical protein
VCKFSGETIPSIYQKFQHATGVNEHIIRDTTARVAVRMVTGWSKLDAAARNTDDYDIVSPASCHVSVGADHIPTSCPNDDSVQQKGVAKLGVDFSSVAEALFVENPFASRIPATYEDQTLRDLIAFF